MSDHGGSGGHGGGDAGGHGGGHGGHKKKHHHHKHEEHEHEEGWIVGFADNVLLQMGFFVILLAMNLGPKGGGAEGETSQNEPSDRMIDFAIAVREAFHSPVNMDSTDPNDLPLIRRLRERINAGDTTAPGPDGDKRQVQSVRPSDWTGKDAYVEFGDAQSDLSDAARSLIKQASEQVVGTNWIVEVRGHTSKLEAMRDQDKARRLSYERAWTVAQELVQRGVRWEQIMLVAAGDVSPVKPRARRASEYAENQRVEILVTRATTPEDPYSGKDAGGANNAGEPGKK